MIVNDPVFGFIDVDEGLIKTLVTMAPFQRLNRIKQLGPTALVYPGAVHTRFQHSLGTLHLVTSALRTLMRRGIDITPEEQEATKVAMLLHDIGHAPMSHALEGILTPEVSHEEISLAIMRRMDATMNGALTLAINIYSGQYAKHFLHELVCSQLDMDRLDYLCRDSLFAGVREGSIGVERIVRMLSVADGRLVVDQKGLYTIENYLMARRLMYWQVYYHKTALATQELVKQMIARAQTVAQRGEKLFGTPDLLYFLENNVTRAFMDSHPEWLDHYLRIDDSDITSAAKQWTAGNDRLLAMLASDYIERRLYKSHIMDAPIEDNQLRSMVSAAARYLGMPESEAAAFVVQRNVGQTLYSANSERIGFLFKDGTVRDISELSEFLRSGFADHKTHRYYVFVASEVAHLFDNAHFCKAK